MSIRALVCGAGGFIGAHLVKKLKQEGYWVRGVDLKYPEYSNSVADEFVIGDLRDPFFCSKVLTEKFDCIYQLAADMGGAEFVFSGKNDADIAYNSAMINLNVIKFIVDQHPKAKVFFSSSACVYPDYLQIQNFRESMQEDGLKEEDAYPAQPDSIYGKEKLFSEDVYDSFRRNHGIDIRIGRFHNIFGPLGTWRGGREKAPANICRQVAEGTDGDNVVLRGNGKQARSFLYITECLHAIRLLMDSNYQAPVNIGSSQMLTTKELAEMVIQLSGKKMGIHIEGKRSEMGVDARNSNNELIKEVTGWAPSLNVAVGLQITYDWINEMVQKKPPKTYTAFI